MKNNFKIEFSSFLTKKEREILKLITDMSIKNQNNKLWIKDLNLPKNKNGEINFFDKLNRKSIFIIENTKKTNINYLKKVELDDEYVFIQLNDEFFNFFIDKKLKKDYSLYDIVFLKHNITVKFFFDFIIPNLEVETFKVTLPKLKDVLDVENYTRIYDLERYILNIIKDDLEDTHYKLEYKKIKKLGRIEEIEFNIINKKNLQTETSLKMLLFLFKKYITNKENFSRIVRETLENNDNEFLKERIIFTLSILDKFDFSFEKLLEHCIKKEVEEKLIIDVKENYMIKSKIELQKFILRDVKKNIDDSEFFSQNFSEKLVKKIYQLEEDKTAFIEVGNTKLEITYSLKIPSKLIIYKKILTHN